MEWGGKVAVEEVPRLALGAPHEAIVRITATTICGSDLHLYHASIPAMRKGDILGHECMGIVDEVAADVTNLAVGDRVGGHRRRDVLVLPARPLQRL